MSNVHSLPETQLVAKFEKQFLRGPRIVADLQIPSGFSVTTLFGPSGCGKTTVLRCLAGLERPNEGTIQTAQEAWFDAERGISLSPQQRDIGFLFQDYALFPHMTVAENIGFGLRNAAARGPLGWLWGGKVLPVTTREDTGNAEPLPEAPEASRDAEIDPRVLEMLQVFDLLGLEHRRPSQISGGQQQRVALARVLVRRPKLLLLDEPLSALDATLREQLRTQLRRLLVKFQIPVVIVTHDRTEAIALSDQLVVMEAGRIRQSGTVQQVITRPNDLSVARIVGVETVAVGTIVKVHEGLATVQVGSATLLAVAPDQTARTVHVCIRGEDVAIQKGTSGESSVRNHLPAVIQSIVPEGPLVRITLDCGFELTALVTRPACEELRLDVGDHVTASLKAPAIHLIPHD
jgi:molybdate transport system ATP-binding protein